MFFIIRWRRKMKLVKIDTSGLDDGNIGRGVEVSGQITFQERLQVDGRVMGKIASSTGALVIGEMGRIEAQIEVGICVIHGTVQGDVMASARIEIHRTGKVNGDLVTPSLLVEEGAVFNGSVKMTSDQPATESVPEFLPGEKERRKIKGA
jgi:cytoskeletal protein CcmA (bactofilin family)